MDPWFVQVTVVPTEMVAVCGLKAKFWIVIVNTGDTLVWFALAVVTWDVGATVIMVVAGVVFAGVGAVVPWDAAWGVEAIVVMVVARAVAAGAGAVVAGVVAGPDGDPVHPAINTANRITTQRIGNLVRTMSMLIEVPHDMIYSMG